jgi:hypothetical protein
MKHHHQVEHIGRGSVRATIGVLPLAIAVVCGGVAFADKPSPTVTGPMVVPPISPRVARDQAAPPTDYGPDRPVPAPRYAAPVDVTRLHAPAPTRPVAPIVAPVNTIRIGQFQAPAPAGLSSGLRDEIDTAAATVEARISTYCRSVGVSPNRCDRIAGAATAGAIVGGGAAGLPIAVPIGLLGEVVGGLVGGVLATVTAVPYLLVPWFSIPQIIAGGVAGASVLGVGLGAALAAPAAAAGGLVGGVLGAAAGAVE